MTLGILLSMFPESHETFILRELAELDRQGVRFELFSYQRPRDPVTHPDARRLMERTHYGALLGWGAISAFAGACLRHPLRMVRCLATLFAAGWRQPRVLLESIGILPLTLHFGRIMRARGIERTQGHWRNVATTGAWILDMIEGIPWAAAIHGEDIFSPNPFLRRKLAGARFIAVCNGFSCRHLKEKMGLPRPDDVHLNYHGLEPGVWTAAAEADGAPAPDDAGAPIILSIGRLFAFKGHDDLIRAAGRLRASGIDFRLRIIGEGPEEANLRALAEETGIADRVAFPGRQPFETILREIRACRVFCLASIWMKNDAFDGIPNVLAEAMAFGKPVVSTRVSGIPELVEEGVSGLLVDDRDPEALAEALEKILTDDALATRLGEAARPRVRALFDLERNVGELIGIYRQYGWVDP